MASTALARTRPGRDALIQLRAFPEPLPLPWWKRVIDVIGAGTGLVVLSPLFLMISLAVVLDSRGSPFFRQTRVGRGGRCFSCWKFRSMHRGADALLTSLIEKNEAEGAIFKMTEDPRRTRVGKLLRRTSMDELPQLWNVLRGDMSLVGPRPPTVPEVLTYDDHHLLRLRPTPGMTGLWQVTLRGRHRFADMVELDIRYAETFGFLLDVKILLRTIPTVITGRGSC
jgi:lipopolysaccharide/colanic/teichoic acid biosynthesis glycosyltransferase